MERYMNANVAFSKFSRNYMETKKDLPIRPSEMAVINIITKREGDFTPLAIAELLGVSKSMIAAHIASLEKQEYIYKENSEIDKRSFFVRPTEKAKVLADEFEVKQTEILKKMEHLIGEDEFDHLVGVLEKLNAAVTDGKN